MKNEFLEYLVCGAFEAGPAHQIKQRTPNLRILNFHNVFSQSDCFWQKNNKNEQTRIVENLFLFGFVNSELVAGSDEVFLII